jgi:hypothetical protein
MTKIEVKALNDIIKLMSELHELPCCIGSVKEYKKYTDEYISKLRLSGVDSSIIENCQAIIASYIPMVHEYEMEYQRYKSMDELIKENDW